MVKKKLYGRQYRKADGWLGGLTTGSLFGRPHAGPGNVVASAPMGPQDVPYYRHDRAYQKAIDAGKNPYFTFQPSDQRLMDDLSGSWNPVDLVARGAFGLKKLFSDTPDPKPTFKRVDSVPDPVPVESNVHYTDVVFPSSMGTNPSKKKKKGKKNIAPVIPENSSSRARPPGSGIYGPGGTQSRGAGARRVRTNIKYKKRDFYD